jgi:HEAT repeat protein
LGFASGPDPLVQAALGAGLLSVVLTVGLALQLLWMRRARIRRERRAERFLEAWRPLVFGAALGEEVSPPPLAAADETTFLLLWNQVQGGLRGPPRAGLNQLARAVGGRAVALRRLRDGDALDRILALRTLGYLGKPADFDRVLAFLDDRRTPLCLAAARALAHIDPARATDAIWARIRSRPDWPLAQLATALEEADTSRLAQALADSARHLPAPELHRLLPLVALLDGPSRDAIVTTVLSSAADPDALAGALRHVRGAALLPRVADLARHPAWPVRTQAAAALGRIGGPGERPALVRMLSDREWWVRYRAAQALLSGRLGGREEIAALARELGDRFARDIVAHVLAETQA